jgi:hypothetical protein
MSTTKAVARIHPEFEGKTPELAGRQAHTQLRTLSRPMTQMQQQVYM